MGEGIVEETRTEGDGGGCRKKILHKANVSPTTSSVPLASLLGEGRWVSTR